MAATIRDNIKAGGNIMEKQLKVTLKSSVNGTTQRQRGTVSALGLHKLGSSHTLPDGPEVRGMLRVVQHMVKVEEIHPQRKESSQHENR